MKNPPPTLAEILANPPDAPETANPSPVEAGKTREDHIIRWMTIGIALLLILIAVYVFAMRPGLLADLFQFFIGMLGLAIYFLPAINAHDRSHHQFTPILLVNLFFGWTILGWILALIWSTSAIRKDFK